MLIAGLILCAIALVLTITVAWKAFDNMKLPVGPKAPLGSSEWHRQFDQNFEQFDQRFNRHIELGRRMLLVMPIWLIGLGLIVAHLIQTYAH
jgi:hypothetical protein